MMSLLLVSVVLMEALQAQSHPITRRELFSQERPLDMAPTSFDDQYTGCAAAMTAALPDLNQTEFQANKVYADGWVLASSQWKERQTWGGFASASLRNVAAQQFGEETFFGIWTCLGASIKGYSFFPGEEEVLIPPFETFQVINSSRPSWGPARIYLRALGKQSTYNCEYIKDKQCKSGPCRLDNSALPAASALHKDVSHMSALSVAKIYGNFICRKLWDLLWQLPGLLVEK
ncbi:GPI-linked NAD(P)(+)--arginine ADP-ribosyltransferase 1 [Pteropus alecto]|uniref:NAD(P)(+)--arginine ADP-ribosyltransferase n=1 Tax=Pteropus alecto TaxID=9402 RepID=L5K500_PTEAL|nr:GPI-linked NAD(P)(+)--arginine ADP-ribosyltransferase 1 [Pteropus alecto]